MMERKDVGDTITNSRPRHLERTRPINEATSTRQYLNSASRKLTLGTSGDKGHSGGNHSEEGDDLEGLHGGN